MSAGEITRPDARLYRRLVVLSRKQLAAIDDRLSSETGKWQAYRFKSRNGRMQRTLLAILGRKQARIGEGALGEVIADLKTIETDEKDWQDAAKKELDYVLIVLHGLSSLGGDERGSQDDSA